ncbi:MAG: (2Fe-2S)-binding protein [Phycisphaerales bacterium]
MTSEQGGDVPRDAVSRRSFIQTLGVSGAVAGLGATADRAFAAPPSGRQEKASAAARPGGAPAAIGPDPSPMALTINGAPTTVTCEPGTTLLEALRLHLGMTGSKEVCDRGACGACSVLVDGRLVASCMMLAVDAIGRSVATIEGLSGADAPDGASAPRLDVLQEAFVRHDALQCGFCTPGLVMACKALLAEHPKPTMEQIRRGLSGNICRCGTYTNIFNAVLEASGQPVPIDQPVPATAASANGGGAKP